LQRRFGQPGSFAREIALAAGPGAGTGALTTPRIASTSNRSEQRTAAAVSAEQQLPTLRIPHMKLFLSWSGDLSRRAAESLHRHFPLIIQGLEPFLSAHDIESGARWTETLTNTLDESSFGILCLTPDNLDSKWLYFEAWALTKHYEGRACCLLLRGLQMPDVPPPLSQFQNRSFTKNEISELLRDINKRADHPLALDALDTLLSKFWPDLESEYEAAIAAVSQAGLKKKHRDNRDLLEEILLQVRSLAMLSSRSSVELISQGSDILSRPIGYDSLPGTPCGNSLVWKYLSGSIKS
jgi:hypothetical protein